MKSPISFVPDTTVEKSFSTANFQKLGSKLASEKPISPTESTLPPVEPKK